MDPASFGRQFYRGSTNDPSIREVGARRRVRIRSTAAGLASFPEHNHSHPVSRNYIGRPFRPPGNPSGSSARSDGGGSRDHARPPGLHDRHIHHYPSPLTPPETAMQGPRSRFRPHQGGVDARPRRPGPVPREATTRHLNDLPYLRMLPQDGVGILDLFIYLVGDFSQSGRDQIGNQSSGLSEESITNVVKTRICRKLEEAASMDEEDESCVICQEEYEKEEKIGFLDCGHEYHADCLKKWLLRENVCPICRSPAITL